MLAIFKKEFKAAFTSPIAYIFLFLILIFSGYFFVAATLGADKADLSPVFANVLTIFLFAVPVLTMRIFSEEKRQKTDQLLLTSPKTNTQIVMGKFFAAYLIYLLALLIFVVFYITVCFFVQPPLGIFVGNMVALSLVGAAFIAIGVFISSLTENQIVSVLTTFGIFLLLLFIEGFKSLIPSGSVFSFLTYVIDALEIYKRFNDFTLGIFDFSGILYYLSVAGLFLFLTTRVLEKRRWN